MASRGKQLDGVGRVLIAEDSRTQAEHLRALLEDGGYAVQVAENGALALAAARADPPDLVISDVQMPEMNGYEFCRALKSDADLKNTPFMLVTSLSTPSDVVHGLECGADNFITKPYEEVSLLERVRYLLTNSALRGSSRVRSGIELDLAGKVHFITAERHQILDLLISTYADAVRLSDEAVKRGEQLRESYETMAVLHRSAESLNKVRTEEEVATESLKRIQDLSFCGGSWFMLTDDDGMVMRIQSAGLSEDRAAALTTASICACQRDLHLGKLTGPTEISDCARLEKDANQALKPGHASIPLVGQQRVFGVLNVLPEENRAFTAVEMRVLSALGNQITAAMDRAYLNSTLERQVAARTEELRREIAVRQKAEAVAIASAMRLERAQRIGKVGSAEMNLVTNEDNWSPELYRILGLDRTTTRASPEAMRDRVHPDDRAIMRNAHERTMRGEVDEPIEIRIVRSDGEVRWLSRIAERSLDQGGSPASIAATFRDITERKLAEDAKRESEQLLQAATLAAEIGIFTHDHTTNEISWSPQLRRHYDIDPDVPITLDLFVSRVHPDDRPQTFAAVQRSHDPQGNGRFDTEHRAIRRDGEVRWILSRGTTAFEGEGADRHPVRTIGAVSDVSAPKTAELKRRQLEERFRLLIDSVKDYAILTLDAEGRVATWNEGARRIKGYTESEILGQSIERFYPPEDIAAGKPARMLAQAAADGRAEDEGWRVRKDGIRFFADVILTAIRDEAGKLTGFAKITRDVTQSRSLEEQLRQSQKMEAVGNLTGGIAHDFNNILAVVIGNLDLLKMELTEGTEANELVDVGIAACVKGSELTKSLLAFSRRQPLQPKRIDINKLLNDSVKMLSRAIGESIQVQLKLGTGVWDVNVDPSQLESALLNMMVNSRDAMPEGGIIVVQTCNRVLDEAYAAQNAEVVPGKYSVLEVSDTGTGMTPEVMRRVFEPFFTTKEKGKGTGLGLAMVFGFVKQSGGHIKIYSEVGHGTTIRVYLPRVGAAAGEVESVAKEAAVAKPRNELILVVEDNPAVRRAVIKQLSGAGYRIEEAEHATKAVEILENGLKPDLIFSDVIMPGGMTGADLAREANRRWPDIKVLLTSGFPEGLLENGNKLPHGVNLLSKPYRMEELYRKLREVLDG